MSSQVTQLLVVCFAALALLAVIDLVRTRRLGSFAGHLAVLALAFLVLWRSTGFPIPADFRRQSFGAGDNPWPMISLVFVCILAGMAARYFFYLQSRFTWSSLLRPVCVSPIVLLPLLGTLQDTDQLEALQVVSFCVLAFQNGFFWRVVFERAQASLEAK